MSKRKSEVRFQFERGGDTQHTYPQAQVWAHFQVLWNQVRSTQNFSCWTSQTTKIPNICLESHWWFDICCEFPTRSLSFQVFAQQINIFHSYSSECLHAWFWLCFWKIHFASLLQNCAPKFFLSTQHFLRYESFIVFTNVENYLPPFFSFSQSPQRLKLLGSHFSLWTSLCAVCLQRCQTGI